jgi:hypothetical protein
MEETTANIPIALSMHILTTRGCNEDGELDEKKRRLKESTTQWR